jgi:signal transduction histidine kinase
VCGEGTLPARRPELSGASRDPPMTYGMVIGNPDYALRVLGGFGSGLVGIDAAGEVVLMNEGARRILGCPEGGAELASSLGRPCCEVLAHQPLIARLLLDTLDGRRTLSRAELALQGEAGRNGPTIGFTLAPVHDGAGAVCGAAILFRDLTRVERSEEQEQLQGRLAALGEMAAGLAHEIRNPLASMELSAGLLRRRLSELPELCALVDDLLGGIRCVADTVAASLDFVRPLAPALSPVPPVELVEQALERAGGRARQPVEIERRYECDVPTVRVDRELLVSALANLVVNAYEAMAAGDARTTPRLVVQLFTRIARRPERAVRVRQDGEALTASEDGPSPELVIGISDTGPGIPEEQRERIFYPFYTTKERGSGVGLASVQKIVLAHGGHVELDSRPGEGCAFRVHLPLCREAS